MFCKKCGRPAGDTERFCKYCGSPLIPSAPDATQHVSGQPTQQAAYQPQPDQYRTRYAEYPSQQDPYTVEQTTTQPPQNYAEPQAYDPMQQAPYAPVQKPAKKPLSKKAKMIILFSSIGAAVITVFLVLLFVVIIPMNSKSNEEADKIDITKYITVDINGIDDSSKTKEVVDGLISGEVTQDYDKFIADQKLKAGTSKYDTALYNIGSYATITVKKKSGEKNDSDSGLSFKNAKKGDVFTVTVEWPTSDTETGKKYLKEIAEYEKKYGVKFNMTKKTFDLKLADKLSAKKITVKEPVEADVLGYIKKNDLIYTEGNSEGYLNVYVKEFKTTFGDYTISKPNYFSLSLDIKDKSGEVISYFYLEFDKSPDYRSSGDKLKLDYDSDYKKSVLEEGILLTGDPFTYTVVAEESSEEKSSEEESSDTESSDETSSSAKIESSDKTSSKTESKSDSTSVVNSAWPDSSLFGGENNIKLNVWVPDKAVALTKSQVEEFISHYSDINFSSIEVVAQGEADAATLMVNDPEQSADVFGLPSDQLYRLREAEVLTPVASGLAPAVKANNTEKTIKAATYDNQLYAYPETNDNGYYLVYDRSVVSDSDAGTFEGVLSSCKSSGKKFIMDCGNGYYSCIFAFTGGAEIDGFESDEYTQKFVDYDEDTVVDTLMAFAKLMKTYKGTFTSQDPENISAGFRNGTVGAGFDGTWNASVDKEALGDNFGAAKLPTIKVNGENKQIISMFGYKYIGVNSNSKFPHAAQILAYYLSGQECQEQRASELGWGPSNIEAQKSAVNDPVLAAVTEQSNYAVPQVNIAGTFWNGMGTMGAELYKDSWNPDDRSATKSLFEKTVANVRDE